MWEELLTQFVLMIGGATLAVALGCTVAEITMRVFDRIGERINARKNTREN